MLNVWDKDFSHIYEVLTLQQKNAVLMSFNDAIVELVERQLNLKLAYNDYNIDLERMGFNEEIRVKLDELRETIKAKARNTLSTIKITEITEEDWLNHTFLQ